MTNLSTALVFLTAALSMAAPSKDILIDQVKNNLLAPNRYNRMLQLSDECTAANEALTEDPILIAAIQEATGSCPGAISVTENSMTIDYSVCPSIADELEKACDAVNGTTVPVDKLVVDCKMQGERFKITWNTLVECLAAVCDASKYGEHIANLNSNPELDALMASLGAECTFSSSAYHLGLGVGVFAFLVATTAALFV